jgi:antirestriction protein ArdC
MTNKANEVIENLIKQIESGTPPWKCGWEKSGSGLPTNATTGREYTGINILNFWCEQASFGYSTGLWVGFEQAKAAGGNIRKGEKAHSGIRVNTIKKKDSDGNETGDVFKLPAPFLVWNLDQCNGLDHLKPSVESHEWNPIDRAESLMVESGATIQYGGERAFYAPSPDRIQLPERVKFKSADDFYSTAIHELGHWTGHESRLNRSFGKKFGIDGYAFEELVAEMSCAITKARIGLEGEVTNHASYLESWLKVLRKSPSHLMTASSAASKASDYLVKQEV